jgi:hypothetical protein
MHTLRKGEAFPQVRRRSRRSSFAGPSVIWTSLGKPCSTSSGGRLSAPKNSYGKRLMANVSLAVRGTACENLSFATYFVRAAWYL